MEQQNHNIHATLETYKRIIRATSGQHKNNTITTDEQPWNNLGTHKNNINTTQKHHSATLAITSDIDTQIIGTTKQ